MKPSIHEKADLSKYIEIRDNRPHIRGRRLPIAFIVSAQKVQHLSIAELADEFTLSEPQVLAALLYYYEHQPEIDAQDVLDAAQSVQFHQRYGKKPSQE